MALRGAVVIGGFINGLGLVRALAAQRVPVAVVTTQPYDIAHRSRWCREHHHLDELDEFSHRLGDLLQRRRSAWQGWALIPTTDEALRALAVDFEPLSSWYRVCGVPMESARPFFDKKEMNRLAAAAGVACPADFGAADQLALDHRQFPVVVKPRTNSEFSRRFGKKLFFAPDSDSLQRAISATREAHIAADVSDYIPGPDSEVFAYCTYLDGGGEPRAGVTVHKLRQAPPRFGIARVAEVVSEISELRDATIALARRLGHRGAAVAEFKRDARDGRFRFIEMNGRSVIYNALLRRAGVDLAALTWSDFVAGQPTTSRSWCWPGVWIHEHADLLYSLLWRGPESPDCRSFLLPYRRAKELAVWSPRDPLPFSLLWGRTLREGVRGLRAGSLASRVRQ